MHRLVNRAIEEFLRDTYGDALWDRLAGPVAGLGGSADITGAAALGLAAARMNKAAPDLFEDLGAWLARREPIRRLLRFSGRDFEEFLIRLEELPGRAHLVVPELGMPQMRVSVADGQHLRVDLPSASAEWCAVLAGMLRAMADDYGVLGLISVEPAAILVEVSDGQFAQGRDFSLSDASGRAVRAGAGTGPVR